MRTVLTSLCLFSVIITAGCTLPWATPILPTSTGEVSQVPTLTVEQLKNFTYHAPQFNRDVTLQDGTYKNGSGETFFSVSLLQEMAFGDLDSDGREDAAVLLAENGGGSGVFVSLIAVLNINGTPLQAYAEFIDDRPIVHSVEIVEGEIILDATLHGPNDPMVSPTFAVTKTYGLGYGGLILTRVTSQIPDGTKERSIQISSPKDGDKVTGSIQVKGSMPIGPFENNLAYHITDPSGNEIGVGPFMVNAAEPGAPATFDNALDISALPKGKILFQLVEVSMADGSIISLDAVELVVK